MDESRDTGSDHPRIIAFSDVLGPINCRVVGRNRSHYLVQAYGTVLPVPKERVFELQDGWELRDGQILPVGHEPAGEDAPAILQFEMETAPSV